MEKRINIDLVIEKSQEDNLIVTNLFKDQEAMKLALSKSTDKLARLRKLKKLAGDNLESANEQVRELVDFHSIKVVVDTKDYSADYLEKRFEAPTGRSFDRDCQDACGVLVVFNKSETADCDWDKTFGKIDQQDLEVKEAIEEFEELKSQYETACANLRHHKIEHDLLETTYRELNETIVEYAKKMETTNSELITQIRFTKAMIESTIDNLKFTNGDTNALKMS